MGKILAALGDPMELWPHAQKAVRSREAVAEAAGEPGSSGPAASAALPTAQPQPVEACAAASIPGFVSEAMKPELGHSVYFVQAEQLPR
eukprot:11607548-Karenia_brevis.AAC.1